MPRRATHCAVLCVLALWPLSACGGNGGQGTTDRPSVTTSLSPTRTLPSPTRSPDAPQQTESEPNPSRSPAASPDTTRLPDTTGPAPTASTTREPQSKSPRATARTTTVTAAPVPEATHSAPSPSPSPVAGAGQPTKNQDTASPATWLLLGLLVVAAALGTWLVVKARKRRGWLTRLEAAEEEVAWFARELVPQLRTSRSADEVVGGWHVAMPRAAAAEDQLTVLSSSARNREDAARALQLRDAVRSASQRLEALSGPGGHDQWALDLDDVEAILVAALGPSPLDTPRSARTS